MKIFTAPHLSPLYAVHPRLPGVDAGGKDVLCLAMMLGFNLKSSDMLSRDDVWEAVIRTVGEEQALDTGYPKPGGEFLVYGDCRFVGPGRSREIKVECAGISRYVSNPCELRGIPAQAPKRIQYFGQTDAEWMTKYWPGVPQDYRHDFAFQAPAEQRLQYGNYFQGGERVQLYNMHPEFSLFSFNIPAIRCRMFLQRNDEKYYEIENVLETLWIFSEIETGLLLFRGLSHTLDEQCSDIKALIADTEPCNEPRPPEYYLKPYEEDESGPAAEAEDSPAESSSKATDAKFLESKEDIPDIPEPVLKELESLVCGLENEVDEYLARLGVSKEQAAFFLKQLRPIPEAKKGMQEMVGELEVQSRQLLKTYGLPAELEQLQLILGKHSSPQQDFAESLKAMREMFKQPGLDNTTRQGLQQSLSAWEELEKIMVELEGLGTGAQSSSEAPEQIREPEAFLQDDINPDKSLNTKQALQRIQAGQSLEDFDLSDCDFSGQDLSRASLSGAFLAEISFAGADLRQADFRGAYCQRCDFREADLSQTDFSQASLEQADLSGVQAGRTIFAGADLEQADFSKANLEQADLSGADCSEADFKGADLSRVRAVGIFFTGADLQNACLSEADLSGCRMDAQTKALSASFEKSCLQNACLGGADLSQVDFSHCDLRQADLSGCCCRRADFYMVLAQKADLSQADCQEADFWGANLFKSSLRQTDCRQARLQNVNLFGADLYRCRLDPESLVDCTLDRTLLDMRQVQG